MYAWGLCVDNFLLPWHSKWLHLKREFTCKYEQCINHVKIVNCWKYVILSVHFMSSPFKVFSAHSSREHCWFNIFYHNNVTYSQRGQMCVRITQIERSKLYTDVELVQNKNAIKKNTEVLIKASKVVGLEVNQRKLNICWCRVTRMQVKIITYMVLQ